MKTFGKFLLALFALCVTALPMQAETQEVSAVLSVAEAMAVNEDIEAWDASRAYNVYGTEEGIKVQYEGKIYQLIAGTWSPAGCKPSEWTSLWQLVGEGSGDDSGSGSGGGSGSGDDDISNSDHQMVGGLKKHLMIGYWHNFNNGASNGLKLSAASTNYDFLDVSFGETDASDRATITFVLDNSIYANDAAFIEDIKVCQARGQKVLLSLGGQNGVIAISDDSGKSRFVNSVIKIIEKYGFDGLDIDFEGTSVGSGYVGSFDNPTADQKRVSDAIREICDHFGSNFILTMAPETAYVQFGIGGGSAPAYLPLIYALRDKLTVLHVQLYNTGTSSALDGKNYQPGTADYLVAMCDMMLQGFTNSGKTFPALAQDQVAIGVPACTGAAGSGVASVDDVKKALQYLISGVKPAGITYTLANSSGYPDFRGVMTWSVNWDATNSYALANTIAAYYNEIGNPIVDGDDTSDTEAPSQPTGLTGTATANSIALSWSASTDNVGVRGYNVYVNGSRVGSTTSTSYTATGLTANTSYTIEVEAYDAAGNKSGKASTTVKTQESQGGGSLSAAPTPTKDAANVKSIYSGKYSSPTLTVPDWAYQWLKTSENGLEKVSLDGDEALHLNTFNFAAYDLSTTINASDMGYLHIDVYPVNAPAITFHPNGSETVYVGKSLTAGQWNSFDIPLSDFSGFDFRSVSSIKLTGENGADADGTKELYVDNIYFWKNGSDQGGDQGGGNQGGGGSQGDGSGDYRFVVYFPNWGVYNAAHQNVTVGMIPWDKVTHINHGFWMVGNDYKIVTTDSWADLENTSFGHGDGWSNTLGNGHLAEYRYYKGLYPNVKVLISVGGWTKGQNFHAMASTAANRAIFIQSVIDTFKKYTYIDGLDIDWEYPGINRAKDVNDSNDMGCPGGPEDKENFVLLVKELREAYAANGMSDKLLTMAASMNENTVAAGPSPSDYAQYLDFINIMTYDAHGAFESQTNHHAAIYPSPNDPCEGAEHRFNAWDAAKLYRSYGVPANKLIIGSPWYSRGWGNVPAGPNGDGLYQSGSATYKGNWDDFAAGQNSWFENAYVPYMYDGNNFMTYEDETSLSERCNFVKKYGFGGIIVWEISGDNLTSGTPMSNIVYNELFVDTTIKQTHEPVTDGIGGIVENVTTDDGYYTLTGVKVNRPVKGVYIHKGKKVVVR